MRQLPRLMIPIVLFIFIALISYNYIEVKAIDQKQQQNVIHRYISQLERFDANLDQQILRIDSWYFANYDKVNLAYWEYSNLLKSSPDMPKKMESLVPKIAMQLDAKFALVEKLKSSNSILRNTINYFPELVSALSAEVDSAARAKIITSQQANLLRGRIQNIVFNGVTKQLIGHSDVVLNTDLNIRQAPATLKDSWENMQKHINVLIEHKQRDEDLNLQLERVRLTQHLKQLSRLFSEHLLGIEKNQQEQKLWLIGYFMVALILILILVAVVRYYSKQHSLHLEESLTDPLTGLGNRRKLNEQIPLFIAKAQRKNGSFGLLFLDLDGFKNVNDSLGHKEGDKLLQKISANMKTSLRQDDLIARVGGDEFVVIVPSATASNLRRIANSLLETCTTSVKYMSSEITVSASIGISCYPDDSKNPSELLEFADKAMYQAKINGKSGIAFYIDIDR